jgi:glycine C-acetyltransferase
MDTELEGLKAAGLYKSERVITSMQSAEIEVAGGAHVLNFCANNYLGLADNEELRGAAKTALDRYATTLDEIRDAGLFKSEHIITSPQAAEITLADGRTVLNFCANNYLGLADHPDIIAEAKKALDTHGFGMASVRFICGTQDLHKQLEKTIADFFGTEDTILYAACFDANGGLFEPLLDESDAIISDALNHASIIDGVRLCKAKRYRYANCDMADLEKQLQQAKADGARTIMITTDGVFSMDGFIAPLDEITALAQ